MAIKLSEHFNYIKLLKFTFPTIVMLICTSLYSVVDAIFISNFAGSDAFAAINIVWPVIMILGAVGFMIGTGGSALTSKTLGENKKQKANQYFSMLLYFEIVIGIILSILGVFIMKPLAKLMGAEGDILETGVFYGKLLLITLTPYILQNSFQSFLVAAEKPKFELVVSLLAGITNIIFDFLFIYLFRWGIVGAAVATGLSQCVGGLVPLIYFTLENSSNYRLVKTGFEFRAIGKACLNGLSEMMMVMSLSIVNMLYNFQLLRLSGTDGVIAYGIIQYIVYIYESLYTGYSNGSAPVMSFHYGAKNTDEIKNLFKRGMVINFVISVVLFGVAEGFAPFLARIFVGSDNDLYHLSLHAIRIYSILFLITGYNVFASSVFTALNNGIISAIISVSRTLIFEVINIFLFPLIFGLNGLWMAVSCAEGITLLVSFILLLLNRKKYNYF